MALYPESLPHTEATEAENLEGFMPPSMQPNDKDVTAVFNRLLRMTGDDIEGIVEVRRSGRADDMFTILRDVSIEGRSLSDWHGAMGHFDAPRSKLFYEAGQLWGAQIYDRLYQRINQRRLYPDNDEAGNAYTVATGTLQHSYAMAKRYGSEYGRWAEERYREHQYLGDGARIAQLNGLLFGRIKEHYQSTYGNDILPQIESPKSFYTGMLDASIFLNAYIGWKDYGAAPQQRDGAAELQRLPYSISRVDMNRVRDLLSEEYPIDPKAILLKTPESDISSAADLWPRASNYQWHVLYDKSGVAVNAQGKITHPVFYHTLARTIPFQTGVNTFEQRHDIMLALPIELTSADFADEMVAQIMEHMGFVELAEEEHRNRVEAIIRSNLIHSLLGHDNADEFAVVLSKLNAAFSRRQLTANTVGGLYYV